MILKNTMMQTDEMIKPEESKFHIAADVANADDRIKVLNHSNTFAIFDRWGDIHPLGKKIHGIYHQGTRFINRLELKINDQIQEGGSPLFLSPSGRFLVLAARATAIPEIWHSYGRILVETDQDDEADRAFSKAIELAHAKPGSVTPEQAKFYLSRSTFLKRRNRLAEAGVDFCLAKNFPVRVSRSQTDLIDLSLYSCYVLAAVPGGL